MPRLSRIPRAPRRPARAGLTLIELLLAIVILAIVMTSLVRMFSAQQQLYGRTREAADVQRDLRMGLSMLPADLRSAATNPVIGPSDLADLTESSIRVRATIGQSVICAKDAAAPNEIVLAPQNLARHTLTTWHAEPQVGEAVLLYNDSTNIGPEDDYWDEHSIVDIQPVAGACAGSPYVDAALDAGKEGYRVVLNRAVSNSVRAGAGVRLVRWAQYSLFKPTGGSADAQWYLGYAEQLPATGAWVDMEPIAGPFRPAGGTGAGITFKYFDADGLALAAPVNPELVARVDLTFRAQARVRGAGATEYAVRDSVALRVALRNRPNAP